MSANSQKVQSIIENTFTSAIKQLTTSESATLVSDLYVQADPETGELSIFDDTENLLEKVVIFNWVKSTEEESAFNTKVITTLKAVLNVLVAKDLFADPTFTRPLSVSLTDEEFVVIEELLFLDDDTFRLDDPLLKDLDADLDNFINELLSDI